MEAPPPPGGYFGRALVVDLADASAEALPLPEDVLRAYIGGAGLGAWLMHRLAPPRVEPLAPEAPLAFCFSPLVGHAPHDEREVRRRGEVAPYGDAQRRARLEP